MYHYYKIEVIEDFEIKRKLKNGFIYIEKLAKGKIINSIFGLDSLYVEAVKQGHLKIIDTQH